MSLVKYQITKYILFHHRLVIPWCKSRGGMLGTTHKTFSKRTSHSTLTKSRKGLLWLAIVVGKTDNNVVLGTLIHRQIANHNIAREICWRDRIVIVTIVLVSNGSFLGQRICLVSQGSGYVGYAPVCKGQPSALALAACPQQTRITVVARHDSSVRDLVGLVEEMVKGESVGELPRRQMVMQYRFGSACEKQKEAKAEMGTLTRLKRPSSKARRCVTVG